MSRGARVQSRHQTPIISGGGRSGGGGSRWGRAPILTGFLCQHPGAGLTTLNDSL